MTAEPIRIAVPALLVACLLAAGCVPGSAESADAGTSASTPYPPGAETPARGGAAWRAGRGIRRAGVRCRWRGAPEEPQGIRDGCWPGARVLWWRGGGSNSRPSHCERDALPAELPPHNGHYSSAKIARPGGPRARAGRRVRHGPQRANSVSISRRTCHARVDVSMATSSQVRLWPFFTGRTTLTSCARPSGRPPMRTDASAGSSLPHTV